MPTIEDFVRYYGITMRRQRVRRNPNFRTPPDWHGKHWRCRLSHAWGTLSVYYSAETTPTVVDVLRYLAESAWSIEEYRRVDRWAEAKGWDHSSYATQRAYAVAVKLRHHLRRFLGKTAYRQLLYEVDRR